MLAYLLVENRTVFFPLPLFLPLSLAMYWKTGSKKDVISLSLDLILEGRKNIFIFSTPIIN